jgi:hypothetical protein
MKKLIILNITLITIFLLFGIMTINAENINKEPIACSSDARVCLDGTIVGRTGPNCEFICPNEKNLPRNIMKREENHSSSKIVTNNNFDSVDGMSSPIYEIKKNRKEFQIRMEEAKDEIKKRNAENKNNLQLDLGKITDQKKQEATRRIFTLIENLNEKFTSLLSDKVNQIENVLVSIESRIIKANDRGILIDDNTKSLINKSKELIVTTRKAILTQSSKYYLIKINTDETLLKGEMSNLRTQFNEDIKIIRDQVKLLHTTVRQTALSLSKIQKIDQVESIKIEE